METLEQPGQGNADPLSFFEFHGIVRFNQTYYDPSYGKTYTGPADFVQQAVAGWWKRYLGLNGLEIDETAFNGGMGRDINQDGDTRVTRMDACAIDEVGARPREVVFAV